MRLTGRNLTAVRGGRRVFADLSFSLSRGEVLAVMGPNGSGKSTLLRLIAGLLQPASGTVVFDAEQAKGVTAFHYLGHLDGLKTGLTVRQNLAFWCRAWGGGDVEAALARVGLSPLTDLPVGVLSAGQRRRAAIARILLLRRPVWLLDEPATALDAQGEETLVGLVRDHVAVGGIAVVATHRVLPLATATLSLGAI